MEYYRSKVGYARDAVPQDVALLKDNLRETTIDELWAVHHFTPEQSLHYSLANSVMSFTVIVMDDFGNESAVAMGGVLRPDDIFATKAQLWFLTSNKLQRIELSFLRKCKYFISKMLEIYPLLYNYVDIRNLPAIKWLKWIGADFGSIITFGLDNRMFKYFEFKNDTEK